MAFAWRSSVEAGASLGLIAVAAVLTLIGGLLSMALIPVTLLVLIAYLPPLGSLSGIQEVLAVLWFPAALTASLYVAVTGLEQMNDPDWRGLTRLALLTAGIFATFALGLWAGPFE